MEGLSFFIGIKDIIIKIRISEGRVNELRHQILSSAQFINFGTLGFHSAEINISIELGAEITAVPKLLVPNIDCLGKIECGELGSYEVGKRCWKNCELKKLFVGKSKVNLESMKLI